MNDKHDSDGPHSGKFILDQLQRFGSDINRKHEVSFWLYFDAESSAREAAKRAEATGMDVEVSPPLKESEDSQWLCLLYCPHVPDESLLDGISQYCTDLTSELGGRFDGWEASLELEEGEDPTKLIEELKASQQKDAADC